MPWLLRCLAPAVIIVMTLGAQAQEPALRFSYEILRARARTLAGGDFHSESGPELPEALKKLSYDDYQRIHFVPSQGPWQAGGLRFTFQFFHRGFIYQDPVAIHLVDHGEVQDFVFSPRQFDYGKLPFAGSLSNGLEFAGIRVLYPVNSPGKQDEVAAFLGASYFRIIGAGQRYGASARGLAVNTAEPEGEEFPRFTHFWIEKPGSLDASMKIYALLDGPSVAGAYQFTIEPGEVTQLEVDASLFFRKPVKKMGVGPLTSMFLKGKNDLRFIPDFRPEVHDSDGLLIEPGDSNLEWRPLSNPQKEHWISRFPLVSAKGFGLLQRDRNFDHYQDLGARYELRPTLWIEPRENWGAGNVELVEIPSPAEYNDNIVAYWVPSEKTEKGQERRYKYRLSACLGEPLKTELMKVEATRITPEHAKSPPHFVIDFSSTSSNSLPADAAVEVNVESSQGKVRNLVIEKNEITGGWRTFFDWADTGNKPADLRLFLHKGNQVLSETWMYHYQLP
ncbi:MAG TPA: glucan biosynthesis protein [Verrucomicrobiae bacterium]|nr:glucan biosynthesis protein [Verrucomicrobiae bacterium]